MEERKRGVISAGILVFLLGGIFGSVIYKIYNSLNSEYIFIRIIDDTKCHALSYSVVLDDKSVTVSEDQIKNNKHNGKLGNVDLVLKIMPNLYSEEIISYAIKAKYHDCQELVSDIRKVERGWGLYEWIRENKITHQVRSR